MTKFHFDRAQEALDSGATPETIAETVELFAAWIKNFKDRHGRGKFTDDLEKLLAEDRAEARKLRGLSETPIENDKPADPGEDRPASND